MTRFGITRSTRVGKFFAHLSTRRFERAVWKGGLQKFNPRPTGELSRHGFVHGWCASGTTAKERRIRGNKRGWCRRNGDAWRGRTCLSVALLGMTGRSTSGIGFGHGCASLGFRQGSRRLIIVNSGQASETLGIGMQYVGRAIVTGAHWFVVVAITVVVLLREAIARPTRAVVVIIEAIGTRVARIPSAAVGITVVTDLASFVFGRRALAAGRHDWQFCEQLSKHQDEPKATTTLYHHHHHRGTVSYHTIICKQTMRVSLVPCPLLSLHSHVVFNVTSSATLTSSSFFVD